MFASGLGSDLLPDGALVPHAAPLGLVASACANVPAPFAHDMFVAQHGSSQPTA